MIASKLSIKGELEDALEIALRAAGGVHKQLCDLGLSCEDLGKTSVHLSITAQEAPPEVMTMRLSCVSSLKPLPHSTIVRISRLIFFTFGIGTRRTLKLFHAYFDLRTISP